MHRVTSVIVPPVLSFDVSIPLMVFNSVPHYDVRICTARPGAMPTVGGPDIVVLDGLDAVEGADTVIAVGSGGEQAPRRSSTPCGKPRPPARGSPPVYGCFRTGPDRPARRAPRHDPLGAGRRPRHSLPVHRCAARPPLRRGRRHLHLRRRSRRHRPVPASGQNRLRRGGRQHGRAARGRPPVRPGGQSQFIQTPLPPERGTSLAPHASGRSNTSIARSPSPTWPVTPGRACAPSPGASTQRPG